jgi:ParB/RepB/Spo0J family partition protein
MIQLGEIWCERERQKPLSASEFSTLKESIRAGTLLDPIKVRPDSMGGFELISGHNRYDVAKALNWSQIPAEIWELDDGDTELIALIANLFSVPLPDYKKYQAINRIVVAKAISFAEAGRLTDQKESAISRLRGFEKLPPKVHDLLIQNPRLLGATAASLLAGMMPERAEKIIEAVTKLSMTKGMTEMQAVHLAETGVDRSTVANEEPHTVRDADDRLIATFRAGPGWMKIKWEGDDNEAEQDAMTNFIAWVYARARQFEQVEETASKLETPQSSSSAAPDEKGGS